MPLFQEVNSREIGRLRPVMLCQDAQGWLWVGAEEGLFLYDGHTFQRMQLPSNASGRITALFWWREKLWVGFNDGLIIHGKDDFFRSPGEDTSAWSVWMPEGRLPRKAITAFATDARDRLWVGTDGEGLYYYDQQRLHRLGAEKDGLCSNAVSALCADRSGHVWVATEAGVNVVTASAPKKLATLKGIPDVVTTAITVDIGGNVWIGTHEKGICCYRPDGKGPDFFLSNWEYGPVTSIAVWGKEEVWVGTEAAGLIRVALAENDLNPLPDGHGLSRCRIRLLFKDREGILWAAPARGGLFAAHGRVGWLNSPVNQPMAVLADSQGQLWVGGTEGLFVRRKGRFTQIASAAIRYVTALWAPADFPRQIWVGTYEQGVYILAADGRVLGHFTRSNGLPDNNVLAIVGDEQQVWLATFGGVAQVDRRHLKCRRLDGIRSAYIYTAYIDRKKRVWFGTQGHGLYCLDGERLQQYTRAHHPALKTVYSLVEDPRGGLWLSAEHGTLLHYDNHTLRSYPNASASIDVLTVALQVNADSLLIIGRDDGFCWLSLRQKARSLCPITIDLPALSVGLNATCKDQRGHVWIGTTHGLWRVAAYGEPFVSAPAPVITSVLSLTRNALLSSPVLSASDNHLEFSFDAAWYTQHPALTFRYRLEGVDLDWKLTRDHHVHYSQLPPGHYTFRLQVSKCAAFDDSAEARWSFYIKPPLWKRWWFQLLAALTAGGMLYAWIKSRERYLRHRAHQRQRLAEAQLEVLKTQINPHFLFNSFNTLTVIIEENPSVAVEYVARLAQFYRGLLDTQGRDYVSLHEERERVAHYAYLMRIRHGEGFILEDRLGHLFGYIVPLSLQTLVENAVKHNIVSVNRPLKIELFADEEGYITVRNNLQRRTAPAPGTRLGLKNLIWRYRLLGGPPVIIEERDGYFWVKIPIKSSPT